jgi:hypothetical protein
VVGAAIVHTVLRRLLAIVDTVRVGDPFIVENAQRLNAIAWNVAALEGLRLIVAAIAAAVWEAGKIEAFSFAPWLAVLLLFVLAGAASGARMRADLRHGVTWRSWSASTKCWTNAADADRTGYARRHHGRQPVDPQDRQGEGDPLLHARGHLRCAGLPAGRTA